MSGGSRYGLIADVHSNLQALEVVLAWIDAQSVDAIYCLGDVVGYGGDPGPCVERVRERCATTVMGNHDAAVVDPSLRQWFNAHAREAIERQADLLEPDARSWLSDLPWTIDLEEVSMTHAGFAEPSAFDYVTGRRDAERELRATEARWGFVAHTHVPAVFRRSADGTVEKLAVRDQGSFDLDAEGRFLVNPGSVGQPRDGDPRAACAVFDRASGRYHPVRLEYDIEAAQEAIHRSGMPAFEAERLARGR